MKSMKAFVAKIKLASSEELPKVLQDFASRQSGVVTNKVFVEKLINTLTTELSQYQDMLYFGNAIVQEFDNDTKVKFEFNTETVLTNIKVTLDFLKRINNEHIQEPKINWEKPVYTFDEVLNMLNITRNTLLKYINDGYLAFSQVPNSDKRFFSKEDLTSFLNHPDVRKEAWKSQN